MRRIILRRISIAGGTTMTLSMDSTGSCTAMTAASPMSESRSRPIDVMRRLSTLLAAAAPGVSRAMNSELWRAAKNPNIMREQLREPLPLIVGDDPVADPREHDRLSIGGHSLDHENHGGHEGEDDDAGKVLVDVGLIDHVADQIGAERGARRGNSHQAECERIASPLAARLLPEQPWDKSAGAIGVREQSLKIRVEHARSVARPDCGGDAWRAVLAQAGALFKRNRRVRRGQLSRAESLRCHAS